MCVDHVVVVVVASGVVLATVVTVTVTNGQPHHRGHTSGAVLTPAPLSVRVGVAGASGRGRVGRRFIESGGAGEGEGAGGRGDQRQQRWWCVGPRGGVGCGGVKLVEAR